MHFDEIEDVVGKFDEDDAVSIKECMQTIQSSSLHSGLALIESHISFLPDYTTCLEEAGIPLLEGLSLLRNAQVKIESIPGNL